MKVLLRRFDSKFGCESTSSKYVCVGERGFAFCAYERWAVLSMTSLDVDAPCDFQRVPSITARGIRVFMDGVVFVRVSCFTEDLRRAAPY